MKKTFLLFATLLLIGAGCTNPFSPKTAPEDTFGQSRFGTLLAIGGAGVPKGSFQEGGWVRPDPSPFWWDAIETAPGQFDWAISDAEVKYWNEQNQAMLVTIWPFAEWDQKTCHANEPKTQDPFYDQQVWLYGVCNVEAYQRFVTSLIERYDGDGLDDMPGLTHAVKHWEIGDAPNQQTPEITYFQAGPYAYAELLQLSFDAIKAADPAALVVTAGQSSVMADGTSFFRPALTFARNQFDIANVQSDKLDTSFNSKEYRGFINGLGFDKKPFWISKAIVGSPDPQDVWDEDTTARMTFIGYVSAFGNGAERIFGPRDSQERVKQAFDVLLNTIGAFDEVKRINDNAVLFTVDGRSVFALWNDASLPGDYSDQQVDVIRYDGSRDKVDASTLKANVPMFVFTD